MTQFQGKIMLTTTLSVYRTALTYTSSYSKLLIPACHTVVVFLLFKIKATTITIRKHETKLTVAKKTLKKSVTKKVTAVLKDNTGKVINSKKLTMKVNGKTYTAKTNSKGVATFTYTAKFAGMQPTRQWT